MKIFVIIVTYKGKQWYDKCLGSLRESTIPVQIIAVDNSPGEEDAEYIKSHFPEVHLIKTTENLGFGRANNIGMRYALDNGCDYVFLLNQDAWLDSPDTLQRLCEIYQSHPEYGIISPMHLNTAKNKLMMNEFSAQKVNGKLISDLYFHTLTDIYSTTYIHAAAWMLSRRTLEIIGGFDPIFFQYGEDDNYLHRVIFHSLKIGICPSARIIHDHRDSTMTKDQVYQHEKKAFLVDLTNINIPYSLTRQIRHYLRLGLRFAIHLQREQLALIWNNLVFCYKMNTSILKSRRENIKVQPSWLDENN